MRLLRCAELQSAVNPARLRGPGQTYLIRYAIVRQFLLDAEHDGKVADAREDGANGVEPGKRDTRKKTGRKQGEAEGLGLVKWCLQFTSIYNVHFICVLFVQYHQELSLCEGE